MQCFLVGGAVRDALLGLPVGERDWVVVGATVAEMLRLGFRQVGRDFPVFLHPQTHEEYALARTERKTAAGHVGFVVHADAAVTLEQDLLRRDLTVNALARTEAGAIIDPYGGQRDLHARVLRHVSPAFVEDPLRVLRAARFAAQLGQFGFVVAPATLTLMQRIAAGGELHALSAERVWGELHKALATAAPERFFTTLQDARAIAPWFLEMTDSTAPLAALAAACAANLRVDLRFAAMLAALPPGAAEALATRLRAPKDVQQPGLLAARHGAAIAAWVALDGEELLGLFERCDAFRRAARFADLCAIVSALRGVELTDIVALAQRIARVSFAVSAGSPETPGMEIGRRVRGQRLAELARLRGGGDAQPAS